MNNKTYAILNISDLDSVDFSQIHQTSKETIRKSIDENLFLIKYVDIPSFINDGTITPISTHDHASILAELNSETWKTPIE